MNTTWSRFSVSARLTPSWREFGTVLTISEYPYMALWFRNALMGCSKLIASFLSMRSGSEGAI